MADISITPGSVVAGTGATFEDGIAGATITAGQTVYKDASDSNKFKLYDADSGTAAARTLYGIALNGASSGQPLRVHRGGLITIGGAVLVGRVYVGSDTAGGIMPAADLEDGDYTTVVGVATTTGILKCSFLEGGVAHAT